MSQRRTGGTGFLGGGTGRTSGEGGVGSAEDVEQIELADEMGRLSPQQSHGGVAAQFESRFLRSLQSSASGSSNVGLILIWIFLVVSFGCAFMTDTRDVDMSYPFRNGWRWSAPVGPDDVWLKGSGRTDLNFNSTFNPDDLTMTQDECDAFFPDLYREIDRSVEFFSTRKVFDRPYLDRMCKQEFSHARVAIYNNRLYIKMFKPAGFTRVQGSLALLHQAVATSREKLPNVEFCIGLHDWASEGLFGLDRAEGQEDVWLMPDYSFFSWPEHVGMYNEMREKERKIDNEIGWAGKKSKLFWRGSMKVGTEDRKELMAVAKGYPWNEMNELEWGSTDKGPILMEDHCKYKFHAYPDGNTYSGRLRYLQNCRTVVVTHPQHWIQHYTHLFNGEWGHPDQNIVYIPPPENGQGAHRSVKWGRLPEVMDNLLKDDSIAERIADNVVKTFRDRYVVPATATCYWRRAMHSFATIQQYEVTFEGTETSYENFLLQGMQR